MGNDGGAIPKRIDIVKKKERKTKADNVSNVQQKATCCAFSKVKFDPPLAVCKKGRIFNKRDILKAMIDKNLPEEYKYIRKLKNIVEINPDCLSKSQSGQWIIRCPITLDEYNGFNHFAILRKCGCIFSQKAIDKLQLVGKSFKCPNCQLFNKKEHVVELNQAIKSEENTLADILSKRSTIEKKNKATDLKPPNINNNNNILDNIYSNTLCNRQMKELFVKGKMKQDNIFLGNFKNGPN